MFYLIPSLGRCFQGSQSQENGVEQKKETTHQWTKLEKTGLVLDILIMVSAVIAASLAVCAHLGVPLGPFNGISVVNLPGFVSLYVGAAGILLADLLKGCSSQGLAEPKPRVPVNSKPRPTNGKERPKNRPNDNGQGVGQSSLSQEGEWVDANDVEFPDVDLKRFGQNNAKPVNDGRIYPSLDDPSRKSEDKRPESNRWIDMETEIVEPCLGDSFVLVDDSNPQSVSSSNKEPSNLDWLWNAGGQVAGFVMETTVQVVSAAAGAVLEGLRSFFKPGSIQKRLHSLQVDFILEQILSYSETEGKIQKNILFPITREDKLGKLKATPFEDDDLEAFRMKIITIMDAHRGDDSTIQCMIQAEIHVLNGQCGPKLTLFLQQLCYELFNFKAMGYGDSLVEQFLPHENYTFDQLPKALTEDRVAVANLGAEVLGAKTATSIEKGKGTLNVAFAPMLTGVNFANLLWEETYSEGKTVKIIRFGTPTTQTMGTATVIGQMRFFLAECQRRGETLLIFHHQSELNGEGARLEAMNALQLEFPDTLLMMKIDMDSPFYNQNPLTQPFSQFRDNLVAFMQELKQSMTPNLAAKFPDQVEYNKMLYGLVAEVRRAYFNGLDQNTEMTIEERRDFVFLAEALLMGRINQLALPTFSCGQCKDSRDRTISMQAARYLMTQKREGLHKAPETIKTFRTLSNFVGMIVKGGPMDEGRYQRYESAIKRIVAGEERGARLSTAPPTVRSRAAGLHAKKPPTIQIDRERQEEYTYAVKPCDALTLQAYTESIREGVYPILSLKGRTIKAADVVTKFFQNNSLNCTVQLTGQTSFQIRQGLETILASGTFFIKKGGMLGVRMHKIEPSQVR